MAMLLVVDDSAMDRRLVGGILEKNPDWTVIYAVNGKDALAEIEMHIPDLVLTDMQMPAVGGSALALALRCLKPDLPVVVMSGADEEPDERMKKLAATYLSKPFEAQTLLSTVRRALDLAGAK